MVSQSTLQPSAIAFRFLFYFICQSSFKSFMFLSQSILLDSFNFQHFAKFNYFDLYNNPIKKLIPCIKQKGPAKSLVITT